MFSRSARPPDRQDGSAGSESDVEFVGFSEADPYLYQFIWSGNGRLVSLHDAACTQIEYSPIGRKFRLSFHLDGLGESTTAATGDELVLTFDNARAISWNHDNSTVDGEHAPWRGQVGDLNRTGRVFVLALLDLEVVFEATTVTANIR